MTLVKHIALDLFKRHAMGQPAHPDKRGAVNFVHELLGVLYPHHSEKRIPTLNDLELKLQNCMRSLELLITPNLQELEHSLETVVERSLMFLPELAELLDRDAEAMNLGDPAAVSADEVVLSYPGFFAIAIYRIAHHFYQLKIPFFPRMLTEYAHERTGIDIHPGAQIGKAFFIDHGTGVVIGESSVIHERVKLYQGVTLGALVVDKQYAQQKRHPTIESDVVVYAHATILGGDTVVGHHSVIGGNVWITSSVQPYSKVYNEHKPVVRDATPRA